VIVTCSFCGLGRNGHDVVGGPGPDNPPSVTPGRPRRGVFICRNCVELANQFLQRPEELPSPE
jgi:hypothetical protein